MKYLQKILILALALALCFPAAAYDTGTAEAPIRLSTGLFQTAYVDESGILWIWQKGEEGKAAEAQRLLEDVTSVSVGADFLLALKRDGTLWSFGGNAYGQLGTGTTEAASEPVQVLDRVAAISAGDYHAAALRTDGTLWSWGDNLYGQLGDGTLVSRAVPTQVLEGVVSFSAGANATAAVLDDGTLWTWGDDLFGQLGDGEGEGGPFPRQVMTGAAAVSMGGYHAAAIDTYGNLWTWGSNIDGQLGNGGGGNASDQTGAAMQTLPIEIELPADVAQVSAGTSHTAALLSDGSLYTWGGNASGQLGQPQAGLTALLPGQALAAGEAAAVSAGTGETVCLLNGELLTSFGGGELTLPSAAAFLAVSGGEDSWLPPTVLLAACAALLAGLAIGQRKKDRL